MDQEKEEEETAMITTAKIVEGTCYRYRMGLACECIHCTVDCFVQEYAPNYPQLRKILYDNWEPREFTPPSE